MEGVQKRVQSAVNSMLSTLDKEKLRKMQGDMYKCSARCCENPALGNMEEVNRCIENCSEHVSKAQTHVQAELQNFQERLQRCALDCQDRARDKIHSETKDTDVSRYKHDMEVCVVKCADTHIDLIPAMLKRMKDVLSTNT